MYTHMVAKDYRFSEEAAKKTSEEFKHLVGVMLEPDEKKRWDIEAVCEHPWIPLILQEAKRLLESQS